jgi:rifampin ADP-ribosylating transferase
LGDGPGRIYVVEPTGALEDDPNLTNTKFEGNPTLSYRTTAPVLVVEELLDWEGHPAEQLASMRAMVAEARRTGVEAID